MTSFPDRDRAVRFEHMCRCAHALGPRPFAELLAEIGAATGQPEIIVSKVEAFARLDPVVVRAVGADQFPPKAMEVIR